MEAAHVSFFSTMRLRCAVVLTAICSVSAGGCRAIEQRIVFAPYVYPDQWSEPTTAELTGLCLEDVCFDSLDGTRLHGWYVRPQGAVASSPILFAHGRTGHIGSHKDRLFAFVRRTQANVFMMDYRGYGKSDG